MNRLTHTQQSWLKLLHLIFATAWLGGQLCIILLEALLAETAYHLHYPLLLAMSNVDDILIVSGAMGCLLTGILFALFTNWGFGKFTWLQIKWFFTIVLIIFGATCLADWVNSAQAIAASTTAPTAEYHRYNSLIILFGTLQTIITLAMVAISVFKPNKKKKPA